MITFDTDVLTELLRGNSEYIKRASDLILEKQMVPIVVVEELVRGRLNTVRRGESGRGDVSIPRAYEQLQRTSIDALEFPVLAFSDDAQGMFDQWRSERIRVGTHD